MRIPLMALAAMLLLQSACSTRHEVQMAPVEVKPIHITIDVNVRVQKDLEDFFSDIDKADQNLNPSN
ncbi:Skp family chaperone for outer membrane proteins [Desulfomicrobium macestii]|uniref:YnbE-like lipoprotein n=2 Tax=Desulfomicrobium TaxID=898 RepID=A0A8G2C076_DESNO|nr:MULTISPECIES: YnbE family lipoprotein [Desulfomicrobium]MBE1423849.1 Skp family chaperone for outer membrane proteins [Desulfomicrobium macestii]SFL31597.1 YnbE-like lipoprotein [Desulfomicrobium norvegicum]